MATGTPGALDAVASMEIADLATNPFGPTMSKSLKERLADVEASVRAVTAGIDVVPSEGDSEGLRKAMSCIYDLRVKATELELELDTLVEISSYLEAEAGAEGPSPQATKVHRTGCSPPSSPASTLWVVCPPPLTLCALLTVVCPPSLLPLCRCTSCRSRGWRPRRRRRSCASRSGR